MAESVCLGREPRRMGLIDRRALAAEARRLLGRFGLDIDPATPLGELSTATQQRVAITRATGFEAGLVIMDKFISSLSAREANVLFDVIRPVRASGLSVLYVSHKLDELYVICDRVTIMRDGRTVLAVPLAGLTKTNLVSIMLGPSPPPPRPRRSAPGSGS